MFLLSVILIITTIIVYFVWNHKQRYSKYNLNGPFFLPFIGNFLDIKWKPFYVYERENLKKYGRTYVDYNFSIHGTIATSEPSIIKKILIKDFNLFYHRVTPNYLPKYSRKSLIFLNKDWKRVRSQISPVFTSGKLKQMFINFDPAIKNCLQNVEDLINKNENNNIEVKKLCRSFALDIIGNVVFSIKTNSYKGDEFSKQVQDLFNDRISYVMLSFVLPGFVSKFFDISIFNTKTLNYFTNITLALIQERKKNKDVVYNDFIELLLKSESEGEVLNNLEDGHLVKKLSTEEIVGNCFVFFLAGQETVSGVLVHILLELALNQNAQEKLYQDLITNYPEEKISYDDLNKSNFLNCVINETLRLHASINRMIRVALSDYDFGQFKVKKGQVLGICLNNLHHDSSIYPEPDKFRPERFENNEVDDALFIPFGDGSRNCIGNRFALLEIRSVLIYLLRKYRILPNENTLPVKYRNTILVNVVDDLRLKIERR